MALRDQIDRARNREHRQRHKHHEYHAHLAAAFMDATPRPGS
jgi:hypothetical protein